MIVEALFLLRFFFRPNPTAEIAEEVRLHVESVTEANMAAGMGMLVMRLLTRGFGPAEVDECLAASFRGGHTGGHVGFGGRPGRGRPGRPPLLCLLEKPVSKRPNIVGKAVSINSTPTTVVGVMPPSFDFDAVFSPGSKVDCFGQQSMDAIRTDGNTLTLVGRMKPGVTPTQATAELGRIAPQLYWSKRMPDTKGSYGAMEATSLKEHVAGELRRSLNVLWAAVGLILLIACVNLSNLLIARAATRSKEFALRVALGAGRSRLVCQLLTESAVLSLAGAALGLLIAFAVISWLTRPAPARQPPHRQHSPPLDNPHRTHHHPPPRAGSRPQNVQ